MYDIIIVGGGPAGITAGIYAVRAGRKTLLVEKGILGGQIAFADMVENYTGFLAIHGLELAEKFKEHAKKVGVEILDAEVTRVESLGNKKLVKTNKGDYETSAVIIASGATQKTLDVKGGKEFANKGFYYCAVCDGPLFVGKNVVVVGGGDSAVKESLFLANIVNSVTIVHRRDKLRAEKINQELAFANKKIKFIWNSTVEEITGEKRVEKVRIRNLKTNEVTDFPTDAIFIYIGLKPTTDFIDVKKNEKGLIITDEFMNTNIQGIYAAGCCRAHSLRQLITSAGEGAVAAMMASEYIESLEHAKAK